MTSNRPRNSARIPRSSPAFRTPSNKRGSAALTAGLRSERSIFIFALTNMFSELKVTTYSLTRMRGETDEDLDWPTAGGFYEDGRENYHDNVDSRGTQRS